MIKRVTLLAAALAAVALAGCDFYDPVFEEIKTVGKGGGTVRHPDGVVLEIPPGALRGNVDIHIYPDVDAPPSDHHGGGVVYRFEPEDTEFLRPFTITMPIPQGVGTAGLFWGAFGAQQPQDATYAYDHLGGLFDQDAATMTAQVLQLRRGFVDVQEDKRTVVGVEAITSVTPTDEEATTTLDLEHTTVQVVGTEVIAGGGRGDGRFVVRDVPTDPTQYWFRFRDEYFQTSGSAIDAGLAVVGDATPRSSATQSSSLVFSLTNLSPWTATDKLQVFSSENDIWWFKAENRANAGKPAPGDPTLDGFTIDTLDGDARGNKYLLKDADLHVTQLATAQAASDGEVMVPYRAVQRVFAMKNVTQTNGASQGFRGDLKPVTTDRKVSVTLDPSLFTAGVPAAVTTGSKTTFTVGLQPGGLDRGTFGARVDLLNFEVTDRTLIAKDMLYPSKPFVSSDDADQGPPEKWGEYWSTRWEAKLPQVGTSYNLLASNESRFLPGPNGATVQPAPLVTFAQNPTMANKDIFFAAATGVGVQPEIKWQAPRTGKVAYYRIDVYQLLENNQTKKVSSFTTGSSPFTPPVAIFQRGKQYVVAIAAVSFGNDDAGTDRSLHRTSLPYGEATLLSGVLTP